MLKGCIEITIYYFIRILKQHGNQIDHQGNKVQNNISEQSTFDKCLGFKIRKVYQLLLSNTKLAEDIAEEVIGSDLAKVMQGLAYVQYKKAFAMDTIA